MGIASTESAVGNGDKSTTDLFVIGQQNVEFVNKTRFQARFNHELTKDLAECLLFLGYKGVFIDE